LILAIIVVSLCLVSSTKNKKSKKGTPANDVAMKTGTEETKDNKYPIFVEVENFAERTTGNQSNDYSSDSDSDSDSSESSGTSSNSSDTTDESEASSEAESSDAMHGERFAFLEVPDSNQAPQWEQIPNRQFTEGAPLRPPVKSELKMAIHRPANKAVKIVSKQEKSTGSSKVHKARVPVKQERSTGSSKVHKARVIRKQEKSTTSTKIIKSRVTRKHERSSGSAKVNKARVPIKQERSTGSAKVNKARVPIKQEKSTGPGKVHKARVPIKQEKKFWSRKG